METKHNIIRRALEQAPGTQLPEGFCVRLMERLERESERRERRETWLLGTAGVLCLLAVIAGLAWYLWYEPGVGLHLPDMPSLPRHTRVARPGLHTTSRTGFPGRKQAAVPVLRLYRRDVPRPRRARPLPAQAQAQCRENKRTPAPINRAHRQPGGFRACGTLPAVVRHAPALIGCRTIPDGKPTAENGQRSADGRRPTADNGQRAVSKGVGCGLWAPNGGQ